MADARWNRAKQVFHEAIEKTGPERAGYVRAACGDDRELRAQVEGLLAAHDEAGDFMASPTASAADDAARAAAGLAASGAPEPPGTSVGPYKLLQVIGEGGFGTVYMAEQEHPIRRRVALKIIKLGMDTKEVIARFEAERQALAMMDHPNIAKVLDAGATESGRPYFVMELVKGVPITDYCDANHLTTRERLDLFTDVCKAIHHAHEKGIIHRDIKPSNVMVTLHDGTPVPKIIDFGVAKATNQRLTEKTLFTAYGQFVGTPAYMSPEQTELSGLEIDRRSDVYSLGVLLYELLTGTTPFETESLRSRAFIEVLRIIREDDPPTPSARLHTLGSRLVDVAWYRQVDPAALEKLVRGDLDWIVMRALEKDRRRRYGSAFELADDLGRYFRDEPIQARRPSAGYRLQKLARRKRGVILAAAAVGIAIALGGFLASLGGRPKSIPPTSRMVLDLTGNPDFSVPTRDGLHQLRYSAARRGYEIVDMASGKIRNVISVAPDFQRIVWPNRSLAPDMRLLATGAPGKAPRPDSTVVALRLFSVGGGEDGRVIQRWPADVRWVQEFQWSPQQTHVWVFVNHEDKKIEIASVDVASGAIASVKTLAWRGPGSLAASLSRDGRYIAYHYSDSPAAPRDIFLISADGSREARVEHPADDSHPLFTPDGSGIVFQSNREGGAVWFLPLLDGHPAGAPRAVWDDLGVGGQLMQFSENGSLLYHSGGNRWEIYTADIDLARHVVGPPQLIPPLASEINNAPAFSPDGRVLAHLRNLGRRLVLRDLATGAEREFPIAGPLVAPVIDFCPDGQSVVVSGYESAPGSNAAAAYRVDLQRGGATRLSLKMEPFTAATCVENGREVVYITARDNPDGVSQVVRHSIATGAVTILNDAARVGVKRSRDGSMIGFSARINNQEQLVVMPTRGGTVLQTGVSVTNNEGGVVWLPGGRSVLFVRPSDGANPGAVSPERTLVRIDLDGGAPGEVGRMALPPFPNARFGARHFDVNPTATRLTFERHAGMVNQVWAIDSLLPFIESGATASIRQLRH